MGPPFGGGNRLPHTPFLCILKRPIAVLWRKHQRCYRFHKRSESLVVSQLPQSYVLATSPFPIIFPYWCITHRAAHERGYAIEQNTLLSNLDLQKSRNRGADQLGYTAFQINLLVVSHSAFCLKPGSSGFSQVRHNGNANVVDRKRPLQKGSV